MCSYALTMALVWSPSTATTEIGRNRSACRLVPETAQIRPPLRRSPRNEETPTSGGFFAMELSGLLSNPALALALARLAEAASGGTASLTGAPQRSAPVRPPQGEVLRTIKAVLAGYLDGLSVSEIRRLVEERLGRDLSRSTVKGALAEHAVPGGPFVRRRRGVYRLIRRKATSA